MSYRPDLRRRRDSNPQERVCLATFQEWCNSRYATPPLRGLVTIQDWRVQSPLNYQLFYPAFEGETELESATFSMAMKRSSQLSYSPVENRVGLEPTRRGFATHRVSQLHHRFICPPGRYRSYIKTVYSRLPSQSSHRGWCQGPVSNRHPWFFKPVSLPD